MVVRKLQLKNGVNTFDLNDYRHFLTNPTGLGLSRALQTSSIPSGTKYITKKNVNLPKIKGTIKFRDYKEYENLELWLTQNQDDLEIVYTIAINGTTKEKTAKIAWESLSKGEIGKDNTLSSSISIVRLSNWYNNLNEKLITDLEHISAYEFPTSFPVSFGIKNPHYTKVEFTYSGIYKVWVNVEINHSVKIPQIIIRDSSTNKVVGEIKADSDISEGIDYARSYFIISQPWEREAYAKLETGEKVSIRNKLSIDDDVVNYISLTKGSYIFEVDDLAPDVVGSANTDLFTFTFVEEVEVG